LRFIGRLVGLCLAATALVFAAAAFGQNISCNGGVCLGTTNADVIHASPYYDEVYAEAGDDTVYAGADIDYVQGGDNADNVEGGDSPDTLHGDNGNDSYICTPHPTVPIAALTESTVVTPCPVTRATTLFSVKLVRTR
jgi:hypothetical protein